MTLEYKEPPIGEIPVDWKLIKFKDIFSSVKGKKPNLTKECKKGSLPYLTTDCLRDNKIENYVEISKNIILVNEDDLILLWDGSNAGEFFLGKNGVLASTMAKISLNKEDYNKKFMFYLLKTKENFLKMQTRGTGIPHVDKDVLNNLNLAVPILSEQQKIAEILSTTDQAIQKSDEIIAKTERLKRGMMQELLTKGIGHEEFKESSIGEFPANWEIKEIKDIANVSTGKTPSTSKKEYWGDNIPFITPGDMDEKYVVETERGVTVEGSKASGKVLEKGTVLVVCIGSTVGKTAITSEKSVTNQQINSLNCKKELSISDYIYYATSFRSKHLKAIAGIAAVPIVKKSLLEIFKIPLPPLQEQQKIAEILSNIDKKLEFENKRKQKLERIKKGLMNDLLTGKKRVKT